MTALQVWCNGEHVGHLRTRVDLRSRELILSRASLSPGWDSFESPLMQFRQFRFAHRTCVVDDMTLMIRRVPDQDIPRYAERLECPDRMQTKFVWPVLDVSLEDYDEWVFDQNEFEPL
jgi:hypothetical protein